MEFDSNVCFSMSHQDIFPYAVNSHNHNCFEIVYYVHGEGVSKINGVPYAYKPHTFCIIPPGTPHEEWAITPTELFYIGFDYDNQLGELPICLIKDEDESIWESMQLIRSEMGQREPLYEELLRLLQKSLVIRLRRAVMDTDMLKAKNSKQYLEYAINFITSNYSKVIDLVALANSIGYSYDHFRHLFKDIYGVPPKQFILNTRINQAKDILLTTSQSVAVISTLCGFHSCSQFIAIFKKSVGVTPQQYRKEENRYIEWIHQADS